MSTPNPFADLVPNATLQSPFADLIPQQPVAQPSAFADLVPEVGRGQTAASQLLKGFGGVVGSIPKSLAIANYERGQIDAVESAMGGIENNSLTKEHYLRLAPAYRHFVDRFAKADEKTRQEMKAHWESRKQTSAYTTPLDNPMWKAGQATQNFFSDLIPSNKEHEKEFFAGSVPRGFGSMLGFLATAPLGPVGPMTAGIASGATEGFEDALNKGATMEQAMNSSGLNAAVGTTEALPIMRILDRLDKGSGGMIKRALKNALKGGTEELVQEFGQQVLHNLIASDWVGYDPKRQWWQGSGEAGGAGFTTGALTSMLLTLVGGRRVRSPQTQEQAQEPQQDVDQTPQSGPGIKHIGLTAEPDTVTTEQSGEPITRESVLIPFLKELGLPIYTGNTGSKRLGYYIPKRNVIKLKKHSDLEVASHEIAHLIDDRVFHGFSKSRHKQPNRPWTNNPVFTEELRGVSYDKTKVHEGFAEYVRLWMTQPQEAASRAPQFNQWFENFTQTHKLGPTLIKAREDMLAWFHQSALDRAASKIGVQRSLSEAIDKPLSDFRQRVFDDLEGVYKAERELTGEVSPTGAYETARLTRAAHSIVEGALVQGAPVVSPDGSHTFEGKGLEQILKPVGRDLDRFLLYAIGRSARELHQQGRENLFTDREIRAMEMLETPERKQAFDDWLQFNQKVLDFAQAKGLINATTRKLWKRTQYIPFYRSGKRKGKYRKGLEGDFHGIKRLTGGTQNLNDMLGNMIQNTGMLITEALKNEARAKIADLAALEEGGKFLMKVNPAARPTSVSKEEVRKAVLKMLDLDATQVRAGLVPEDVMQTVRKLENAFTLAPDFLQLWQFGQQPKTPNTFAVMREGKAEYYEVADPILLRAIESLNRPARNWLMQFLNGVRRVGQSTITLTVDFMAANVARDTLMAGVMSHYGFKPFVDSIRGFKARLTKDETYKAFIANGGGFSSYLVDDQAMRTHLERFYSERGIDFKTLIHTPGKLLYFLESLTDAFEMSTRLGEFRKAMKAGAHPRHAAYVAREVSTDFAMRGDSKTLNFLYDSAMFLKAGLNGMDRLYRGLAHDKHRATIAARIGYLALMSMALYLLNRGNPDYEDLEPWDRDGHWHFFFTVNGEKRHFRYSKIWEIGSVASIAERTLEAIMGGNDKPLAHSVGRIVMNQFKLEYLPQLVAPIAEQAMNKHRFTNRPIETPDMQQLAPFARAKPTTSLLLQDVGLATRNLPRALQFPPARAEHLIRGYFNTWALYGLTLADAVFYDDKPTMRVDEYPVFRRFYEGDPKRHTKHETMFYDMLKEATELRRTMREMDRRYRPDIAVEMERKADGSMALQAAHERLQAIHKEMREIIRMPGKPDEKRQMLDQLQREKNQLLKEAVTQ